jgi:uroporphyrinogen decarboxylase
MPNDNDKLLLKAIRGETVPRRPLWIMRQAGRYLPEYRAFRQKHSFKELAGEADLAAEVTLMPLKRYPLDAAIVFADIMSPIPSLGIEFDFDPGPVVANPIRDAAAIERLRRPDPAEIAPEVIAALKLTRAALPNGTALLGFCGAPWTLAAYLVEGKGAKDFPTLRAFAAAEPALLDKLLERLSSLMGEYLLQQAAAGVDAVQIFDSWAGLLSRASWEKLIRPHLMDAYASLPAEVLGVDWRIDLPDLKRRYPHRAVQGNLEPAILTAGAEATRTAARELLAATPARGHIVNLGHGILPQTPLASVAALVEAVHSEKL